MTAEEIYDQYHQRMIYYTRGRFGMQEYDSEQIVSDVFLQLHKTVQNGTEIRNPGAWLRKAVRTARVDWLRYRNRKKRTSVERTPLSGITVERTPLSGVAVTHSGFEEVDVKDTINYALSFLSTDERTCLKLAYYDQLDYITAAQQLGISMPAFQQRVSRARRKLHAVLT